MVPILAQWYIERKWIITNEELKSAYAEKIGAENIPDVNLNQLLRKIRLTFEAAKKSVPFERCKGG